MKIVITGSLGHIGKPLTETLVRSGHEVVVISSQAARKDAIEALGAKAAIGSVEEGQFLSTAFAGAGAVFLMVPPNFDETDVVVYYSRVAKQQATAVQAAGVKRVVHLSSYGANLDRDTGFILGAHHAEKVLDTIPGISLVHLRAGYFYYNLLAYAGMIKTQGIIGTNFGGDDLLALVHPTDIAAAAAEELQKSSTPGSSIRYVVSDERKASEIASVLGAAIGRPDLQWLTFSDEQARQAMQQRGLPEHLAKNFVDLGAQIHNGKLLEEYLHQPSRPLGRIKTEDFAAEFAAAYNSGQEGHQ